MAANPNVTAGLARRVVVRGAVSLLIVAGFVWALRRAGLPLAPGDALSRVSWGGMAAFVGLQALAWFLRTRRWYHLLQPISPGLEPWRVFGVGLIGYAAIFFAPLRLGEFVRPYLLSRDGKITFVQVVGTVAAERVVDGLFVVALTAVALATSTPLDPLPNRLGDLPVPVSIVPKALLAATIMFVLAFAAMAIFYVLRDTARRVIHSVVGVVSSRLADWCAQTVGHLGDSLAFLPSWRRLGPFIRDTLLSWMALGLSQVCLLQSVGLDASVSEGFVIVGVGSLGSLLPAGPGFFGAYQMSMYTSLAMFHPETDVLSKGAVFVFVGYVLNIVVNLLAGAIGLILTARGPDAGVATSTPLD